VRGKRGDIERRVEQRKYSPGARSWQTDSLQLLPQLYGYIPSQIAVARAVARAIPLLLMIPRASSERPEE
jgi:hypothetical protein